MGPHTAVKRLRPVVCMGAVLLSAIIVAGLSASGVAQEVKEPLTLDQAYAIALQHNEDIKASAQGIDQAREQVRQATSPLLPQVNLSAEARRQKDHELSAPGLKDYSTVTLGGSQHLYHGGKVRSARQAAQERFGGEKSRHFRKVQDVLFQVAAQYYEVLLAERSISVAREQITRTKRQLELAQSRYDVGLVDRTAVLRAKVQVANAREQLERAMNQKDVAMENLRLELGWRELPKDIASPEELSFTDRAMSHFYALADANRRDLDEIKKRLQAAQETVKSEEANRDWPELAVEGGYTASDEDNLFYGDSNDWHVALTASYDLFTGWRDTASVNTAKSQRRQIRATYNRLKQSIKVQVRSVYLDIKTQEKVLASLKDQVTSAKANYEQIVAQFEEGLVSSVDVVDAQTALNEADLRLARAYFSYQLDQLRLRLATGTFVQDRVQAFLDTTPVIDGGS